MINLAEFFVFPHSSIRSVITCIDRNAKGIALVVDEQQRLLATVTDGDIRRAILAGINLEESVQTLLNQRQLSPQSEAITALMDASEDELLRLMNQWSIRQIPILNEQKQVVNIAFLNELVKDYELPLKAVIMAGGFGLRLRPLTEKVPKPMLPVGNKPLLELIIEQLHHSGIRKVNLSTYYLSDVISQHFGDGYDFGVEIQYVQEKQPLGTAGALSLLQEPDEPLLVMNGDILTKVDFRAMLNFHRDNQADMTVCVREQEFQVPYGVVKTDGLAITEIEEKPKIHYFINAGIYLINPYVCKFIPKDEPYDMPSLIKKLIDMNYRVVSFPVHEYWLDIGKHPDYEKALADIHQLGVRSNS